MSIYARLRALLVLLVLVIGVSVWLIAGEQRQTILGTQGQLRSSNDLPTAMLDQKTGLRGYALTGVRTSSSPTSWGWTSSRARTTGPSRPPRATARPSIRSAR